jgi:creatinine amidohydrolase
MSYSIFSDTMADMTYPEIEMAARQKLPVLFPVAVIEEHGPHMCLGTDAYLTYNLAGDVKEGLLEHNVESVIAPTYYWGINAAMDGFAGSFTVRPETMVAVLCDLLGCLKSWGFDQIFLLSVHGDFEHSLAMTNAARRAYEEHGLGVYAVVTDFFIHRARLIGKEPYILVRPMKLEKSSEYLDIHAGAFETSLMVDQFPDLVDIETARSLPTSLTKIEDLKIWLKGGAKAREITPLGYLGDPSAIDTQAAKESNTGMVHDVVMAIFAALRDKSSL